jgi:hypothetical protein
MRFRWPAVVFLAGFAWLQPTCVLPEKSLVCEAGHPAASFLGSGQCERCMATECCAEATACVGNDACAARAKCIAEDDKCSTENTTPMCYDRCRAGAPTDGVETALLQCATTHCVDDCNVGQDFSCVGNFVWGPAAAGVSDASIVIQTQEVLLNNENVIIEGYEGLTITPCLSDVTMPGLCKPAGTAGTTDASGAATLSVPTASGFGRFDGFTGSFEIAGPEIGLTIHYANSRTEYRDRSGEDPIPTPSENNVTAGKALLNIDGLPDGCDVPVNPANATFVYDDLGLVVGAVLDCRGLAQSGHFASNIVVTLDNPDPKTCVVYTSGFIPTSGAAATDASGGFFVINAPTGLQTLTFTHPDFGKVAEVEVDIRPYDNEHLSVLGVSPSTKP